MSSSRGSKAEHCFTEAFRAFSQPAGSSPGSFKEQFVPRDREDYPRAVDEDDLDASVLPAPTILCRLSAEDGFDIHDDEIGFDRCHTVFCDPNENAQYFNDEDLFGRLNTDSDYFEQQGGDHERNNLEEELLEEDMLFGSSGWDSDDTVTNARLGLILRRKRVHTDSGIVTKSETVDEDGPQYFDADDLFEREDGETLVYGRDEEIHWYSEDWDFIGKQGERRCWMIDE